MRSILPGRFGDGGSLEWDISGWAEEWMNMGSTRISTFYLTQVLTHAYFPMIFSSEHIFGICYFQCLRTYTRKNHIMKLTMQKWICCSLTREHTFSTNKLGKLKQEKPLAAELARKKRQATVYSISGQPLSQWSERAKNNICTMDTMVRSGLFLGEIENPLKIKHPLNILQSRFLGFKLFLVQPCLNGLNTKTWCFSGWNPLKSFKCRRAGGIFALFDAPGDALLLDAGRGGPQRSDHWHAGHGAAQLE